jgi:2-C-methyl-D-erythritol 4-phosphate cytidylyltransferase
MVIFSVLLLTASPTGLPNAVGGHFVKVDQREVLLRTTELFLNKDNIKQILAVFPTDGADEYKRKLGGHLSFTGVKVLSAKPTWIDQLAAAEAKIAPEATHVLVHDAARPCVPYSDLDALLEAAEKRPAVALAAPVRSPLVELHPSGSPVAIHPAAGYRLLLTPQVFTKDRFAEICKSKSEPHASQFHLVEGSPLNIRVGPADGSLCRAMLQLLPKPKVKPLSSPFEEAQW